MTNPKLSPIQKIQNHFQSKISGGLNKTHVEEWGLDIFYREITTLKQESQIVELSTQGKTVEALVQSIINKALDENGKPLFASGDKAALMNEADPSVVLNLSRILNGGELPKVEDIEKN
jgi:hypothetical protein